MTDALDLLDQLISTKAKLRVTQKHLREARSLEKLHRAEIASLYARVAEQEAKNAEILRICQGYVKESEDGNTLFVLGKSYGAQLCLTTIRALIEAKAAGRVERENA